MKTNNQFLYTFLFAVAALTSTAQETPKRTKVTHIQSQIISKDVHKFSNRNLWRSPSFAIASVGTPAWVQSKGVTGSNTRSKQASKTGNVVSQGHSQWTISKDVQRIRR